MTEVTQDWWSINTAVALFILPLLDKLMAEGTSYPGHLNNREEWVEILKEIRYAFQAEVWDVQDTTPDNESISHPRRERGLQLFATNFHHLWD